MVNKAFQSAKYKIHDYPPSMNELEATYFPNAYNSTQRVTGDPELMGDPAAVEVVEAKRRQLGNVPHKPGSKPSNVNSRNSEAFQLQCGL
ncbi:hypothetical protein Nepgr_010224 [Nepenthes gracilis]|uniref:Uncharacterized protein n=1 Tax=Nepenthes gracilis TaxID=150966 RepID=A0AAD3XL38_NEPGR|nr:hypothetical protein Nepgr_010224 [Nepenthes gracilis]